MERKEKEERIQVRFSVDKRKHEFRSIESGVEA